MSPSGGGGGSKHLKKKVCVLSSSTFAVHVVLVILEITPSCFVKMFLCKMIFKKKEEKKRQVY